MKLKMSRSIFKIFFVAQMHFYIKLNKIIYMNKVDIFFVYVLQNYPYTWIENKHRMESMGNFLRILKYPRTDKKM